VARVAPYTVLSTSAVMPWYYKTMRTFNVKKHDILVTRVKDAQKSQVDARDAFKTALERFRAEPAL